MLGFKLLLLITYFASCDVASASRSFIISAPDIFHLNEAETVAVHVTGLTGNDMLTISLNLEDENGNSIYSTSVTVGSDGTATAQLTVPEQDLPDSVINVHYLYLVAKSTSRLLRFEKRTKVLISKRSNLVFIQLDKPIYTPLQAVLLRVFTMDLDLKPVIIPVIVDIISPDDITVETFDPTLGGRFAGNYTDYGTLSARYDFVDLPVLGKWTVRARYGYKMQQQTEAHFDLKEYSLPRFAVAIDCPDVILPDTQEVEIQIQARYLYGQEPEGSRDTIVFENVQGTLFMRVGVFFPQDDSIIYFKHTTGKRLNTISRMNRLHEHVAPQTLVKVDLSPLFSPEEMGYTFSDLRDCRLYIEATVTDDYSGNRHTEIETKATFSKHQFSIDFSRTPKYFKPGLFTIWIQTKYPNGRVTKNVQLAINGTARKADGSRSVLDTHNGGHNNRVTTSDEGRAQYTFDVPVDTKRIRVEVNGVTTYWEENSSHRVTESSKAEFTAIRYKSASNSYIHIDVQYVDKIKRNELLRTTVYLTLGNGAVHRPNQYFYLVMSRGKIFQAGKKPLDEQANSGVIVTTLNLPVTEDMVPHARLIVYFIQEFQNKKELVVDSLWLEVEAQCPYEIPASISTDKLQFKPADRISLKLDAEPHSQMSLLAVDEAVYQLNDRNIFSAEKLYQHIDQLDIGCSPGSGANNIAVLQDSGVTMLNNFNINIKERYSEKCQNVFSGRKRRNLAENAWSLDECCDHGILKAVDGKKKSLCMKASIGQSGNAQCKNKIYECCVGHLGNPEQYPLPPSATVPDDEGEAGGGDVEKGISEDVYDHDGGEWDDIFDEDEWETELEFVDYANEPARLKFPESFLFETESISGSGRTIKRVVLPDTITTWVLQAVAVHKQKGICIAPTHSVTSFKKIFVKVDMPSTVVKGEQITVKATFYNYYDDRNGVPARGYIIVDEGICAKSRPRKISEFVPLGKIQEKGAKQHSWHIFPLETGVFNITVIMTTPKGADKVEKWLHVKQAGELRNISIPITLDPSGEMSGTNPKPGSHTRTNFIQSDPPSQHVVIDAATLKDSVSEDAIKGTTQCSITVMGSMVAPFVDKLLNDDGVQAKWNVPLPHHCGEQTISRVAPIIMTAVYLKHAGKLESLVKDPKNDIKKSIQSELRYRQNDGSFSFWSDDSNGKYKSTWLTAFVVKLMSLASQEFDISLKDNRGENENQVICSAVDWLIDKQNNMGIFQENFRYNSFNLVGGIQNDLSLTAYVLISLMKAQTIVKTHCDKDIKTDITKSISYLESKLGTLDQSDQHTIAVVHYALTLNNSPKMYESNQILKAKAVYDEERNTRYWPKLEDQHIYSAESAAIAVQQTSYALMSQVQLNDFEYAVPIVSWLLSQRNSFGSFKSTQDTVVALEALIEYKVKANPVQTNLQCSIAIQGTMGPIDSFTITEEDYTLRKKRHLTNEEIEKGNITIDASGQGFAEAYLTLQYFSKTSVSHECQSFDFHVSEIQEEFSSPELEICAQSLYGNTSMGIFEIGSVTGRPLVEESVLSLHNQVLASHLAFHEILDRGVILYFEEIPSDRRLCVTIEIQSSTTSVENVQPAAVTVFDYYEPSRRCTKFYGEVANQDLALQVDCDDSGKCQCTEP